MLDTGQTSPAADTPALTEGEAQIISLMGTGRTSPEIAELLDLGVRTVEYRKRVIYAKFRVSSQSQAVAKAIRLGLLHPGRVSPDGPCGTRRMPHDPAERGRAPLAVLISAPGPARDEVAAMLVAGSVPLIIAAGSDGLLQEHALSWQRGPVVVILVDPRPQDWSAARLPAGLLVICSQDTSAVVADEMAHRAVGLLTMADISAGGLMPALAVVAQGMCVISWNFIADAPCSQAPGPCTDAPHLTVREREVLGSITSGHTIRQTSRVLGITPRTVENVQGRLYRKLGARNRLEAIVRADAWGLEAAWPGDLSAAATGERWPRPQGGALRALRHQGPSRRESG